MQQHPQYTRERLKQLGRRLNHLVYPQKRPITDLRVSPEVTRITHAEAQNLDYHPVQIGEQFGPVWATYWFKVAAIIPPEWEGQRVDLLWVSNSEATLWMNGQIRQGLNSPTNEWNPSRPDAVLSTQAKANERIEFEIEMACNTLGGAAGRIYQTISPYVLEQCDIALFDPSAWDLYYDYYVLQALETEAAKGFDLVWAGKLLSTLNRFANLFDENDRSTWDRSHAILKDLYQFHSSGYVHNLSAVGHAHIDTAWLWPIEETWRKCERTFSTAISYMEQYPEYLFACSQAAQYEAIQSRNPDLYGRIKQRVEAGQFVPVGGSWVEPDCNIPSGEALSRQFLYGQRFFQKEFGKICREFWNPDVFGYNGQLPQIMRQAGITRFLTQKLSWNRFNAPAHHTFNWQGIDGSEVLAHFPPSDTYNANCEPAELCFNIKNFKDHDRSHESILLFGYGDGGGGPTKRMIELLRRARDLQGLPKTEQRSPSDFFDRLEKDCEDRPVIVGELYFELHRGTYTTQAATKKNNRKGEFMLHNAEFLSAAAHRSLKSAYPEAKLDELWKLLLTNQFHDILPGSSITLVYEDSARDYAKILSEGTQLCSLALKELVQPSSGVYTPVNTLGFCREEVSQRPDGSLSFTVAQPYGFGKVADATDSVSFHEEPDRLILENHQVRAVLSRTGTLISLIEKSSGREALSGIANQLEMYDDHPTNFDAWDVDPFHLETRKACPPAESCEIITRSTLRAEVKFTGKTGQASSFTQIVRLDAGARRVEFHTHIQWNESCKMLKVAFPVNVRAMNATYEMQFGCVERPTHFNTTFDLARFEVPGHKWVDLSEHGFGVALLTDCKYGFSTLDNTLHISLLRSPKSPDPVADMGEHDFSYAVMPHTGGWREAEVVGESFRFNQPFLWTEGKAAERSFASVDTSNLVLDTIKKSEDNEDLILRLYEAHGARGVAHVKLDLPFTYAETTNILEEPGQPLVTDEPGIIEVPYLPFQIISIRVK